MPRLTLVYSVVATVAGLLVGLVVEDGGWFDADMKAVSRVSPRPFMRRDIA
jgi:hypothetical protein